jgi:energy-coupling factor transport system substrate-specific component
MSRFVVLGAVAAAAAASAWAAVEPGDAGLSLLLAAGALIVAVAAWIESSPASSREVALVATLGAAAAAGRVLFAPVPGVQPVTVIVVATGAALGARAGAAVGAIAALVSNLFLGQGPWTPWQMLGWAGCGVAGALGARLVRHALALAAVCAVLGYAFSTLMDVWLWLSFYPHTPEALAAVLARGVPFSIAHAAGNVVLALAAGSMVRRPLERYGRRLRTEVAWG